MSRGRFGLLLALLVLVVGTASFLVALRLLDEDDPSVGSPAASTTTSSTTSATVPSGLSTPALVVVVASATDEGVANQLRDELTESGYDAGVLRSDDHPSLEPGFFVAYTGPFPDAGAADAVKDELVADGYGAAYARCVGTTEECR